MSAAQRLSSNLSSARVQNATQMNASQFDAKVDSSSRCSVDTTALFSGTSPRVQLQVQFSAAEGPVTVTADRKLAQAIVTGLQGARDGRISQADWSAIRGLITDGGRYGAYERPLVKLLFAAIDDRKSVQIDGRTVNLTGPAEVAIPADLFSFWGGLGARARMQNAS